MPRAIIIVVDSVGCGAADDAASYGDEGADTLGHVARACASGHADRTGLRQGRLRLPHLDALGLGAAATASAGRTPPGLTATVRGASWGYGVERSAGKDTPSGHWELAGTPVTQPWGYFPATVPCFPPNIVAALIQEARLPGILGNRHASGTTVIDELGAESLRTGRPICYTSADSVFQIAAHEQEFGLARLYETCRVARRLCDPLRIGRIIARPFVGDIRGTFRRTPKRKDFAVPPPSGTLFERAAEDRREVISVGKIGDIFAHAWTGREMKAADDDGNMDLAEAALDDLAEGGFMMVNLVDCDSEFGHRRDVAGYAACLERFDQRLGTLLPRLRDDDLLIVTADHGNDPTFPGTDHTREHVPILAHCRARALKPVGRRDTLADVGASVAAHLGLRPTETGTSFL